MLDDRMDPPSAPKPSSPTSPPSAAQATPAIATQPPQAAAGKPASSLSPVAAPFFPGSSPGRSKAMRWSDESEFSDSETPPPLTFAEVVRGSSLAREPPQMGTAAAVELPAETGVPAEGGTGGSRKRRRRRRRRGPTAAADRASVHHRLGGRDTSASSDDSRIPARRRLGVRVDPHRIPAHQRLGERAPPRCRRRISTPDELGWQEVLPRANTSQQPSRPQESRGRRRRGVPDELKDVCLNCLSSSHKVADCRRPMRCRLCFGFRHMAKDCPTQRTAGSRHRGRGTQGSGCGSGTARGGSGAPGTHQIVQSAPRPGVPETPAGSQATRSTPPSSPPDAGLNDVERDLIPPGHPELRPNEACCVIQRSPAIREAEESLKYSLVAMVVDGEREVDTADAVRAIRSIRGVEEGSFSVVPFFPEHFLVHCLTRETRDRLLAAPAPPLVGTFLIFRPWTRVASANAATLPCKVTIDLEGIPAHAWSEDTVSRILAPYCWIHDVDPASAGRSDLAAFKLTAWTADPSKIPRMVRLFIEEDEPQLPGNMTPFITCKNALRYRVLVHIRNTVDHKPEDPAPSPSPLDSVDIDGGHDSRGRRPRHHCFRIQRGEIDGGSISAGGQAGAGTSGHRRHNRPIGGAGGGTGEGLSKEQPQHVPKAVVARCSFTAQPQGAAGRVVDEEWGPTEFKLVDACLDADTGSQLASDPMVLEAELHCGQAASTEHDNPSAESPEPVTTDLVNHTESEPGVQPNSAREGSETENARASGPA